MATKRNRSLTPSVTSLEARLALSTSTSQILVLAPPSTFQISTLTPTVTAPKTSVLAPGNALNFYGAVEAPIIVPATSGEGGLVSCTPIIVTSRDFYPNQQQNLFVTAPLTWSPTSQIS